MATTTRTIFRGAFVHSLTLDELEVVEDGAIGVERHDNYDDEELAKQRASGGHIVFVSKDRQFIPAEDADLWAKARVVDLGERFLVPGFVDTHTHAPQFEFVGTGRIPLLDWLERYTFPAETRMSELSHANAVYTECVDQHIAHGTTTCCYFATIHVPATQLLMDLVSQAGQRAFVGKVCMDRNSPDNYCETMAESLAGNVAVADYVDGKLSHRLVKPIVTPRFAPTCTPELMTKLGDFAGERNLLIQTHCSENAGECAWVKELHPDCDSYVAVYDKFNILSDKTILAHWYVQLSFFVACIGAHANKSSCVAPIMHLIMHYDSHTTSFSHLSFFLFLSLQHLCRRRRAAADEGAWHRYFPLSEQVGSRALQPRFHHALITLSLLLHTHACFCSPLLA
jgi:guanine deaminase